MRNLIDHADLLYHMGKCDEAVELLSEFYRSHRKTHAVMVRLAELLVDSGHYQRALELLDGKDMGDGDGHILSIVGFCHEALRNKRKAEEAAEKLLSFDGQRANAFTLKAMLALQFGDEERAEKLFHQAIECDSSCAWALLCLGQFLGNRGEVEAGIDYLEKAFRIMPSSRPIALAFHEMAVRSMKYSTAENAFRKVLSHRPLHRRLRFLLIDLLLRQDKYADGILQIESTMADFGVDDGMLSAASSIRQRLDILQNGKPKEPNRRPTISLCMIVKNEESSLPRCLAECKTDCERNDRR